MAAKRGGFLLVTGAESMSEWILTTFPPSLDSEFARFLLAHHGVPCTEDRHTLIFSSAVTLWRAHTVRFPLLDGGGVRLDRVRDMVEHFDRGCAPDRRLVPFDDDAVDGVETDWSLFNETLGTATTVLAYHHLLPLREVMIDPLSAGTPAVEVEAVRHGYWLFAGLLRALLRLSAHREQEARRSLDDVMTTVDARLADGRPFLRGETFTLSDLAFAVSAAPVVWPPEYGGGIPRFDQLPPALHDVVVTTRARPSGAHALRVYRELRAGSART